MLFTNMHKNRGRIFMQEEMEDTKGVIRIRISKNKKKYK